MSHYYSRGQKKFTFWHCYTIVQRNAPYRIRLVFVYTPWLHGGCNKNNPPTRVLSKCNSLINHTFNKKENGVHKVPEDEDASLPQ